jgi:hypothetical protein
VVSDWVSNESFRTVVALFIFWFESGTCWTGDTILTVPEGFVIRAAAIVVEPDSCSTAFALFGGWVDGSWSITLTFARLRGGSELGASGAFSALFGDGIKKLSRGGVALDTVVGNFIIAILTL